MNKTWPTVLFTLLASTSANAVCSQIPLNIKDGGGNTVAMSSASAADGNCLTNIGIAANGVLSGAVSAGAFAAGSLAAGAFAVNAFTVGSIGAGAFAAGAFTAGAVATGAFASGSIAAGAISSGALAAGAISSGAVVASAFLDGSIVTLGTTGDTAWASGAGSLISIAKAIVGAAQAPIPAGTNLIGTVTAVVSGLPLVQATTGTAVIGFVSNDPCAQKVKSNIAINQAATTFQLVAGVSGQKVFICSLSLVAGSAAVVNLIEGTGATCVTGSELAVIGSTTAASGLSFGANNGMVQGNGGATIAVMATASSNLCLLQVGPAPVAGNLAFVQQ